MTGRRKGRQYTIRDVPTRVDEALKKWARREGKSLNQVTVEALTLAVGLGEEPPLHHDLDHLAGTWVADPQFDQVLLDQDRIDPDLWQ